MRNRVWGGEVGVRVVVVVGGIPLLLCPSDKAQFLSGLHGGRVHEEEEGASKSLSSLKKGDSSRF